MGEGRWEKAADNVRIQKADLTCTQVFPEKRRVNYNKEMAVMKFSIVKRVLVSSLLLSGGIGVALAQQDVDIAQQDADNSGGGDYDPCYIHSGSGSDVSWVDDGSGVFGDGWYCMDGVTSRPVATQVQRGTARCGSVRLEATMIHRTATTFQHRTRRHNLTSSFIHRQPSLPKTHLPP